MKLKGCALWNSQNIKQFLNFAPVISAPGKITSVMRRNWEATFDNLQPLKNAHIMLGKKGSGSRTFKTVSASASCFHKNSKLLPLPLPASASASLASTSQTVYHRPENSSSKSNDEASDDYRPSTSTSQPENLTAEKIKMKLQLKNADVASALDRNKTSDCKAVRLMISMAAELGHDPAKLPLSRNTFQRARKKPRRDVTDSVRSDFEPSHPLVVLWNGKAFPKMLGGRDVERLPVFVSGDENEKQLGVPKINAGTGENEANAVYCLSQECRLTEKVQAMSFDTTSVNTGKHIGV